jgi:hypothetical protein
MVDLGYAHSFHYDIDLLHVDHAIARDKMTAMDSASDDRFDVPAEAPTESIICVDCGGRAHLLTPTREDGEWLAGDIVAYRCSDCLDRWDIELPPLGD